MMKIFFCSPAHALLVRDAKYVKTYRGLGHDITFLGNRRKHREIYINDSLSMIEYLGFEYPYYSKIVPLGILVYSAALFCRLSKLKAQNIHARDLEGLIGAYFYKVLVNNECIIIYDIADTYSARYNVPRIFARLIQFVDDIMMSKCDIVLVPQENREKNFRYRKPRACYVIPNSPRLEDAPRLSPCPKQGPFRILLSGEMVFKRGIREIVEAAKTIKGVEIIAISEKFGPGVAGYLRESGIVSILPNMPQHKVLENCVNCHLIGAFYEPTRLINRQAASNKVYDAMAAGRPVLLNSEVEVSKQVCEEWLVGYRVSYYDRVRLCELLAYLKDHREECDAVGARGHALFIEKHNWDASTKLLTDILQ